MSGKIFWTVVLLVIVYRYDTASASTETARLDVFHEVLEKLKVNGSALPESKVDEFFVGVLQHFSCNASGTALPGFQAETSLNTCTEKLAMANTTAVKGLAVGFKVEHKVMNGELHKCFNVTDLFVLLGVDKSQGLEEDNFHVALTSALFFLSRGQHPCNATINPRAGGATVDSLQDKLIASISTGGLISELNLKTFFHEMEGIYEGIDHDHGDDHRDHDDGQESVTRARRDATHGSHTNGTDAGHEDHDHATLPVVEAKCLAPDSVMYYLREEEEAAVNATSSVNDIAAVIVYLMYEGSAVEEKCRLLPKKSDFLNNLLTFATGRPGAGVTLTQKELTYLMEAMNLIPQAHAHDDHAGNEHQKRKRRSTASDVSVSRVKRQATTVTPITKCYTPAQLSAVYETGEAISGKKLSEMSPALVLLAAQGVCSATAKSNTTENHTSQSSYRWLYGSIAVALICLCSVLGVVLLPCIDKGAYRVGIALFVGLAVGTLTGDALLHLIPATMGAHAHSGGDEHAGHDHSSGKIVVEKFVWYSLIILAGIYAFFLLETIFTLFLRNRRKGHGHSHSFDFDLTVSDDVVKENGEAIKGKEAEEGNSSLCVMVIIGDAVHNFADGLAIGASFSSSNSVGIATAIAVFCHELPHELGDFAVLLKSGMTPKKAVMWNLLSSLTAFVGLYVSLAVASSEQAQTWIFAVATGMFLYIALADLVPSMIAHQNTSPTSVFALHNVGILLGFAVMLVIAIFEEHIKID